MSHARSDLAAAAQLGKLLRARREGLAPTAVGLPAGRRRPTPGLRREEVADLASISATYYALLEQGRAPHPSPRSSTRSPQRSASSRQSVPTSSPSLRA